MAANKCALGLFLPGDPDHFSLPGAISQPEVISLWKRICIYIIVYIKDKRASNETHASLSCSSAHDFDFSCTTLGDVTMLENEKTVK